MSKPITDDQLDQLFEAGREEFKSKGNFTTDARFMRCAALRKVFDAGRASSATARPEVERNVILEEAAKVCDREMNYGDQDDYGAGRERGAQACAEAIRALKTPPSPQQESKP